MMKKSDMTETVEPVIAPAHALIMERLCAPFSANDIEWRINGCGLKQAGGMWAKAVCYVTARAVHARLDEIFGLFGWRNSFFPGPAGGISCRIEFRDPLTQQWCWRENGAENTKQESVKGGYSGAEKRTAAVMGIGRYLYRLDETWVQTDMQSHGNDTHWKYQAKSKQKNTPAFYWMIPELPRWACAGGAGLPALDDGGIRTARPNASDLSAPMPDAGGPAGAPTRAPQQGQEPQRVLRPGDEGYKARTQIVGDMQACTALPHLRNIFTKYKAQALVEQWEDEIVEVKEAAKIRILQAAGIPPHPCNEETS